MNASTREHLCAICPRHDDRSAAQGKDAHQKDTPAPPIAFANPASNKEACEPHDLAYPQIYPILTLPPSLSRT